MRKMIGALLILLAIWIGIDGVRKFDASTGDVRFLGIRIHTEDEGTKNTAFLELALAVVVLAGGVALVRADGKALA